MRHGGSDRSTNLMSIMLMNRVVIAMCRVSIRPMEPSTFGFPHSATPLRNGAGSATDNGAVSSRAATQMAQPDHRGDVAHQLDPEAILFQGKKVDML